MIYINLTDMKHLILIIICILGTSSLVAEVRISGHVFGIESDIPYSIKISSDSDSIKATFIDKIFRLQINAKGKIDVTLSALGYKPIKREYNVASNDEVVMEDLEFVREHSVVLKEITVLANKIGIKRDGGNYKITNIQGSYLSKTGTYLDMLGRTPGVFVAMKDKVMIAGAGEPTIYVNNRKVINNSELYMLQSDNVKSIEIIKQPDSEYNSQTNCVIKIVTIQPIKDFVGIRLSNYLDFYRKISNTSILNFNIKNGNLSNNTSISYANVNSLSYSTEKENLYYDELLLQSFNTNKATNTKTNDIILFTGFNYAINKNNTLFLQYDGQFTLSKNYDKINQIISKLDYSEDNFTDEIRNNPHTYWNTIEAAYTSNFANKQSLDLDFNYTNRKSTSNGNSIVFNNNSSTNLLLYNKSRYNIFTFTGKYKFSFIGSDNETFGVEGAITDGNTSNYLGTVYTENHRKSKYMASFYSFIKTWNKIKADFSLRYEFNNISNTTLTKKYSNLLPKLRLAYSFNDKTNIAVRYSKRVKHPTLGEINPVIIYSDSLHYSQGNPDLTISTSDKYELTFNVKGLSLTASYLRTKDPIYWITEPIDNFMVYTPKNMSKSQEFNLTMDYLYNNNKNINLGINAQVIFPKYSYPYMNEVIRESGVYATFYATFNYSVTKNLSAYAMINYSTPHDIMMTHYGSAFLMNMGVSLHLLKGKLRLSLSASDLAAKGYTPWYSKKYMNISIYHTNKHDSRGVCFSVSYNLNKIKTNYQKYDSNYQLLEQGVDDIPDK